MKIFFSYTLKSQDLSVDLLKKIKKKISKLTNIDTYIDILDNNEKEHQDYVYKNLLQSDCVCILKTSMIDKSIWVKKEIDFAKKNNIKIIEMTLNDINFILNCKEEKELFQSMLSFVHSHYQDPLTVRQIAAYGIINKNRCTDLFRKYTRLSPIKYLNEYRLYMAKNLILNTKKPISEISADVGYNQISHFIEQFRGAYGLSPLKYRNQFAGQSSDRTSSLS